MAIPHRTVTSRIGVEINESRGAVGSPRIISFIRHRQFQQSCLRLSTPFNNQLVQPTGAAQLGAQVVAGAAQVGPQVETGAAQLGAHDEPQAEPQQRGLQRRILGMQSFGKRILWQRGLQQLLQVETGAQLVATGAQLTAGAAQVGAQETAAGAQAGAAQVGAAETHPAGAAQLGAQLLQLLWWWNRPAWALFRLAKAARAAEIQTNFIAFSRYIMGPRERVELR